MQPCDSISCTAFAAAQRIASGKPSDVALPCKNVIDAGDTRTVLIFDDATAELVEIDFRGSAQDVLSRLSDGAVEGSATSTEALVPPAPRAPGRPKLGVVGREVTLLPRHWEWLNAQPGGASVALRKLVEQARRMNRVKDRIRRSQEVSFRFMSAMAGNEPGFEEASRALFANDLKSFEEHTGSWPPDIRNYVGTLAEDAFQEEAAESE